MIVRFPFDFPAPLPSSAVTVPGQSLEIRPSAHQQPLEVTDFILYGAVIPHPPSPPGPPRPGKHTRTCTHTHTPMHCTELLAPTVETDVISLHFDLPGTGRPWFLMILL